MRRSSVKVTVAMPAFNAAAYIDEAIASVLSQDHPSFELLVMDDGSTDRTWQRLRKYGGDPRVRITRHARNRGAGATRNELARLARGVYLTPCDADDLLLPGALSRLSACLDASPRVGVAYGDIVELFTKRGRVVRPPAIIGMDHGQVWDVLKNVVNHPGSMMRRHLLMEVGGYDEGVYSTDDWSLWLKLAEVTRFRYLRGELCYVWRRHPASLTMTDRRWRHDVQRLRLEAIRRRYGRALTRGRRAG